MKMAKWKAQQERHWVKEREKERGEEAITNENEIRRQKLCKAAANRNAAKSKKKVQENKKKWTERKQMTLDMPQV